MGAGGDWRSRSTPTGQTSTGSGPGGKRVSPRELASTQAWGHDQRESKVARPCELDTTGSPVHTTICMTIEEWAKAEAAKAPPLSPEKLSRVVNLLASIDLA